MGVGKGRLEERVGWRPPWQRKEEGFCFEELEKMNLEDGGRMSTFPSDCHWALSFYGAEVGRGDKGPRTCV